MRTRMPNEYENVVMTIRLIFKFQTVYDPTEKKQIHLNEEEFQQLLLTVEESVDTEKK